LTKAQIVDKLKKDAKLQDERIVGLEGEVQWEMQTDVQEEIDAHNELGAANEKQSRIEIALRDFENEIESPRAISAGFEG
jgi:hypothetical protein